MEKISLKRSHKDERHIFSFGFLQNLFDCFLILSFFFFFPISKYLWLKSLKIWFLNIFLCSFKFFCFALYNLYNLYSFLGLGHISLGIFFVRVCIVRVVIGLMAKYNLDV